MERLLLTLKNRVVSKIPPLWVKIYEVMLELGFAALFITFFYIFFAIEVVHGRSYALDLLLAATNLLAAVLLMNTMANLELVLHPVNDRMLKPYSNHRFLKWLTRPLLKLNHLIHWIANEGEIAGIFVALLMSLPLLHHRGELVPMVEEHGHHMAAMAFTLLGIMSMANIVVNHMTPLMGLIEKTCIRVLGQARGAWLGLRLALIFGSVLSSLTGEPAAAVFILKYTKHRIKPGQMTDAAVGFAMAIGSGGALTFYAAPPILIIWAILSGMLGWTLMDLVVNVGIACVIYVAVSAHVLANRLELTTDASTLKAPTLWNWLGMLPMAFIIALHIVFYEHMPVPLMIFDVVVAVVAGIMQHLRFRHIMHEDHETWMAAVFQPAILAVLLLALEVIGKVGDPLIVAMTTLIPVALLPRAITGLLVGWVTAFVSHFADNALASRVFIVIATTFFLSHGQEMADFLAMCVIIGSLFGSLQLPSSNLPNFYIQRQLDVKPGDWFKGGLRFYWTGLVYAGWIIGMSFVMF